MFILFVPSVFIWFIGILMMIAMMFGPGLWLLSKLWLYGTELIKLIFESLCSLFKNVFGKLYDMLRYGNVIEKIIAAVIIFAVLGWIINWLRY